MYRIAPGLTIVTLLFLGASGCGKTPESGKTPEQVFNDMVEAAKKEDGKALMATLTRDSQKVITGTMVVRMMNVKEGEEVLKKHAINVDRVGEKLAGGGDPATTMKSMRDIADLVKDPPGFVHDTISVMKKVDPKSSPATGMSGAKIKDVKVEGDKAKGTAEIEGQTYEFPFLKEDGMWKIDMVPLLTGMAKGKG
jgi:hypothetical protein